MSLWHLVLLRVLALIRALGDSPLFGAVRVPYTGIFLNQPPKPTKVDRKVPKSGTERNRTHNRKVPNPVAKLNRTHFRNVPKGFRLSGRYLTSDLTEVDREPPKLRFKGFRKKPKQETEENRNKPGFPGLGAPRRIHNNPEINQGDLSRKPQLGRAQPVLSPW